MAILRSPMAHARLTRVDVSAALERPGVVAAFSANELGDKLGSMPCVWPVTDDIKIPDHPPLAKSEVRFVGDAIAVVIAADRYQAADALEAIEVDYEPLPPVLDMRAAIADGADLVHTELGSNSSYTWKLAGGDYEAAKAKADRVFTRHYVNQRLIPMAMEPRAVVAVPTGADGELTLWSSTQIPHIVRVLLALTAGHPGAQAADHRTRRRRRVRIEAAVLPRGVHRLGRRPAARPPGQVGRDAQRERAGHPPRPGPAAGDRGRDHQRRQDPGDAGRTCSPTWAPT